MHYKNLRFYLYTGKPKNKLNS